MRQMKIGFLGSSDGLAPIGVKVRIFIHEKVIVCLDLECYHQIFGKGCQRLDKCDRLISGLHSRIVWVNFFLDVITSLTHITQLWQLQHVLVNCVVSPPLVTLQDLVYQLQSYDERGLRVRSVQQAVELFGLIHDLVSQLATWSTVLLKSPKLVRECRPGTPISQLVQYEHRST